MYVTEQEALQKVCMVQFAKKQQNVPGDCEFPRCMGVQCMVYWKWKDEARTHGYCGAVLVDEF